MLSAIAATCGAQPSAWAGDKTEAAERRAIAYLAIEVPKWRKEQACYSCHNNGDAARALVIAAGAGALADRKPLDDTLAFLRTPEQWDANGPEGPFKDKKLARVQFAAALVEAIRAGLVSGRAPLERAAALVAGLQTAEGSFATDAVADLGSPVTYGPALLTASSLRVLVAADPAKYRGAIGKARAWLERSEAKNTLDAAATLWALADGDTPAAKARVDQCLDLIRRGQSPEGGWGPYATAPAEVFDTALALIALQSQNRPAQLKEMIHRGRQYLLATQDPDGSWPATTRPSGADSYAQQISTTAWATQALLLTRSRLAPKDHREH